MSSNNSLTTDADTTEENSAPLHQFTSSYESLDYAGTFTDFKYKEAKVQVIYTGGTIGMMHNKDGALVPCPNSLINTLRKYPNMHDKEYAEKRFGPETDKTPLVLPLVNDKARRIVYHILEYTPLLDSSNMSFKEWEKIAQDIYKLYKFCDGFVVLHGTDTLTYTASALSFMLENLGKTVVITGSQIPIFEIRTDGMENFTNALIFAGNYDIPEVSLVFEKKLFRGNRTTKMSSEALDAFASPNELPLAQLGIHIDVHYKLIFRPRVVASFAVHANLDENVGILRIFPNIAKETIKACLATPVKGVVLQSYGSGNIPSNRTDIICELKAATERGVIIVNCTQCPNGSVVEIYNTGKILRDLGIISGFDMTPEAALTKLSYVLSKSEWPLEVKKEMLQTNLRGELTSSVAPKKQKIDLATRIGHAMNLSTSNELDKLSAIILPAMVNEAVVNGNTQKVEDLKDYGADLSRINQDHRTALHIACHQGNLEMVNYLLLNGVSLHVRDVYGRTPLLEAISIDHHEIVKLLIKCGAHLTGSSRSIGDHLCAAVTHGSLKRLISFELAGADLMLSDSCGRTALHVAALHGQEEIVQYLLKYADNLSKTDLLGLTPLDYAQRSKQCAIVKLLNN